MDLETGANRRLTDHHPVIPEFYFDPGGTRLLWSQGGGSLTRIGEFYFASPRSRLIGSPPTGALGRPHQDVAPRAGEGPRQAFFEAPLPTPVLARLEREFVAAAAR